MESSEVSSSMSLVNCTSQMRIKREAEKLSLYLPQTIDSETKLDWTELCQDLLYRLQTMDGDWTNITSVHLIAKDELVDARQLQKLAATLEQVQVKLSTISTSRRQTAIAAATAGYSVEQQTTTTPLEKKVSKNIQIFAEPLYLETTIRSGREIRHPGTVVLLGDLNPGGSIIAQGNILVWGRLRGIAHAGAQGDRQSRIMALKMEPTQLRIASLVARAPDTPPAELEPEIAYITKQGICISKALQFARDHSFSPTEQSWLDSQIQYIDY